MCLAHDIRWRKVMSIERLLEDLKSSDDQVRYNAVKAIREAPDAKATEALVAALDDPYDMVKRVAADALGKIGDRKTTAIVLQHAQSDKDIGTRCMCVAALGNLEDPSVFDSLVSFLSHEDPTMRGNAAEALGKLGDPRAIDALAKCLYDRKNFVRVRVIEALGQIGDPRGVEPLLQYYHSTEGDRRLASGWTAVVEAWKQKRNLDLAVSFVELDNSGERIIKKIVQALESIRKNLSEPTEAVTPTVPKPAQKAVMTKPELPRAKAWWKFWK
jgi:HEAT repeat protein